LTNEDDLAGPLTQNLSEHAPSEGHIQIRYGRVGEDVIFSAPSVPSRPKVSRESDESKPGHDQQWAEWESSRTERSVEAGERIVKIASGDSFVLALRANGEVWLAPLQEGQAPVVWEYVRSLSCLD
jgi:SCF-associated factor 1